MSRLYTENEARILGLRLVCYSKGHDLSALIDRGVSGGVQGGNPRAGSMPAACDEISCNRCDVTFTANYPPIGQEAK